MRPRRPKGEHHERVSDLRPPPRARRWRRADHKLLAGVSLRARSKRARRGSGGELPGSLKKSPFLDSWIRIDADGSITVFTGKAELGQGFKTAFQQIAAEELDVRFESLRVKLPAIPAPFVSWIPC